MNYKWKDILLFYELYFILWIIIYGAVVLDITRAFFCALGVFVDWFNFIIITKLIKDFKDTFLLRLSYRFSMT